MVDYKGSLEIGDVIQADSSWVIQKTFFRNKEIILSVSQGEYDTPMLKEWWHKANISNPKVKRIVGQDGTGIIGKNFIVTFSEKPHGPQRYDGGYAMEDHPVPHIVKASLLTRNNTLRKPPVVIVFNQHAEKTLYNMDYPEVVGTIKTKQSIELGKFKPIK